MADVPPCPIRQTAPKPPAEDGIVRTALAVEPRDGTALRVHAVRRRRWRTISRSLAAVEAAAAQLGLPVHIEGYAPPIDPRLDFIKVTPDPGVIEVNLHPARSWREAVEISQGALRGRARDPASAPRNSCATAATPAPAAAATSWSAARRRPKARSCAARIC